MYWYLIKDSSGVDVAKALYTIKNEPKYIYT